MPLLLAWSEPAPAQGAQDSAADRQAAPLCYRARPKPVCSAFILTNFGGYLVLGGDESNDTPLREVVDWGVMANVSARDALGASVFASLDRLGFAVGPAVRYRRWLSSSASLDLAVGYPVGDRRWQHADRLGVWPREVESEPLVCDRGSTGAGAAIGGHRLWADDVHFRSTVAGAGIARRGVRWGARSRAHYRWRHRDPTTGHGDRRRWELDRLFRKS